MIGGLPPLEKLWKEQVEMINLATKLPIQLSGCSQSEWEKVRTRLQTDGHDIVCSATERGEVLYVHIDRDVWPDSARSLLPLLLSQQDQHREQTLEDQATKWLQTILAGNNIPMPPTLETIWNGKERRACFLIERLRSERIHDQLMWQQLLENFFPSKQLLLLPLSVSYHLLIVPFSSLSEMNDLYDQSLLEWASSIHDLLMTEAMEAIRVIVTPPIEEPAQLAAVLSSAVGIAEALHHYRPRVKVASTWQYPLERFVGSLDSTTLASVRSALLTIAPSLRLTSEQFDTLETFFSLQLNVSETARQLFLHRNTLLYRLDKLTEQTGLDPRQFSDAVLLQLCLFFRQND